MLTFDELSAEVAEGTVDTVLVALVDMHGRLVGKRVTGRYFVEHAEGGIDLCNSLLTLDIESDTTPGYAMASIELGYGDLLLCPDLGALRRLPWRGNVRELRNAIERLIIMTPGDRIDAGDLPSGLGLDLGRAPDVPAGAIVLPARSMTLQEFKDAAEREYLLERLHDHDWNIAATAKAIDTPRSNLYKKLEAHGIVTPFVGVVLDQAAA